MDRRKQYAIRYDAMAQRLYQIAVYLTGDALQARRAIAMCFVSGFDAASQHEGSFEAMMLGELYQCCKSCEVIKAEQYRTRLAQTIDPAHAANERLSQLLCELAVWERATILLVFFGGAASEQLPSLVERTPAEITRVLRLFFQQAKAATVCHSS